MLAKTVSPFYASANISFKHMNSHGYTLTLFKHLYTFCFGFAPLYAMWYNTEIHKYNNKNWK